MKTVFFSWQSDSPDEIGRGLITSALKDALDHLNNGLLYDEASIAMRGSPDIFDTLRAKIERSSIFVADLTIVGKYKPGRKTPNPNVLEEHGCAIGLIGSERVISVMNTHDCSPRDLPFDIDRNNIGVTYDLSEGESVSASNIMKDNLKASFVDQITEIWKKVILRGFGPIAEKLVENLVTNSQAGMKTEHQEVNYIRDQLQVTRAELRDAIDQLKHEDYIDHRDLVGSNKIGPLPKLFWDFDEIYMDWNVKQDSKEIASMIVNGENPRNNRLFVQDIEGKLGWSVRRLNPAISYLVENGIADSLNFNGCSPNHEYTAIDESSITRRYADQSSNT